MKLLLILYYPMAKRTVEDGDACRWQAFITDRIEDENCPYNHNLQLSC